MHQGRGGPDDQCEVTKEAIHARVRRFAKDQRVVTEREAKKAMIGRYKPIHRVGSIRPINWNEIDIYLDPSDGEPLNTKPSQHYNKTIGKLPMKLKLTTQTTRNGFSIVEVLITASTSSMVMSAWLAGLASTAKQQAKSQLKDDATGALSLAKIDFRDSLPLNTTTAPDCVSRLLEGDLTRGWSHLETTCDKAAVARSSRGKGRERAQQDSRIRGQTLHP